MYFLTCLAFTAADKLGAPIDHHLRRVDTLDASSGCVPLLAFGPLRRRKRIPPSLLVPIIDMFFQSDDLRAGDRLLFFEPRQESVGGGASGPPPGGKKIPEDWRWPGGRHMRLLSRGACRQRENRNTHSHRDRTLHCLSRSITYIYD